MNVFYQEGYDFFQGASSSSAANPYRKHTFAYDEWMLGYWDAFFIWWGKPHTKW